MSTSSSGPARSRSTRWRGSPRRKPPSRPRLIPTRSCLGADTTVVVDGEALGKPADAEDAARMLRLLSGRTHEVLTGVCVWHQGAAPGARRADPRSDGPAERGRDRLVCRDGGAVDKAGGYAVQGLASRFIEGIDGSYSNVVGLPISSVYELLKELGCDILGAKKSQ